MMMMKLFIKTAAFFLHLSLFTKWQVTGQEENGENMIKMCLFYPSPSGHGRSDPILNQECASDHVHTARVVQYFSCGAVSVACLVRISNVLNQPDYRSPSTVLRSAEFSSEYKRRQSCRHVASIQFDALC